MHVLFIMSAHESCSGSCKQAVSDKSAAILHDGTVNYPLLAISSSLPLLIILRSFPLSFKIPSFSNSLINLTALSIVIDAKSAPGDGSSMTMFQIIKTRA